MSRTCWRLVVAALLLVSYDGEPIPAGATGVAGPSVQLERTQLQLGQRVSVTLAGWRSSRVNLSVCGNLARRGSSDCNVSASQEVPLANAPGVTLVELFVFAPPTTCPCVVRAASQGQEEVVLVPIELIGVPTGAVVSPSVSDPISVAIEAHVANRGIFGAVRSTLGGPTSYRVKVTLRNVSAEIISDVSLKGAAGRGAKDTAASFDLPDPGPLGPGETWEHEREVTVPALMIAGVAWRVTASGAGTPADTSYVTKRAPVGLFLVVFLLVGDIGAMGWRLISRRQRERQLAPPALVLAPTPTGQPGDLVEQSFAHQRSYDADPASTPRLSNTWPTRQPTGLSPRRSQQTPARMLRGEDAVPPASREIELGPACRPRS